MGWFQDSWNSAMNKNILTWWMSVVGFCAISKNPKDKFQNIWSKETLKNYLEVWFFIIASQYKSSHCGDWEILPPNQLFSVKKSFKTNCLCKSCTIFIILHRNLLWFGYFAFFANFSKITQWLKFQINFWKWFWHIFCQLMTFPVKLTVSEDFSTTSKSKTWLFSIVLLFCRSYTWWFKEYWLMRISLKNIILWQ